MLSLCVFNNTGSIEDAFSNNPLITKFKLKDFHRHYMQIMKGVAYFNDINDEDLINEANSHFKCYMESNYTLDNIPKAEIKQLIFD